MWIRDELPQHLPGIRVVVYGYRTKLQDSRSFQLLTDLAKAFINQLQAYGWCSPSAKPIAFLAHSLGVLVLKEAILQLANSPNDLYQVLLSRTRGAVFFGVPNLGMEQSHFRTIVQNNANEALIDDLARNSNYIRRLNDSFSGSSLNARLKCYWAFETTESHTTVVSGQSPFKIDNA
jgi:predicted alpha/beta hydrolase family esterase